MAYKLARPIVDNRASFKARWPEASYAGDIGDEAHQKGTGDHTARASDTIFGIAHTKGWVYAQDFGGGGDFDVAAFSRWLLNALRNGQYPEVKYVITRIEGNRNVARGVYFGLFDRRYNWRTQRSSGHTSHIHISYMPGTETTPSRIMEDYWLGLHPAPKPDPKWKLWAKRPLLPAYPLGRYSQRRFNTLPYTAYPPLVMGYGGPGSPEAQTDFVKALHRYALEQCRTLMIPRYERDAAEIGPSTRAWVKLVTSTLAGNPWDPHDEARNARAFGASIGAPVSW